MRLLELLNTDQYLYLGVIDLQIVRPLAWFQGDLIIIVLESRINKRKLLVTRLETRTSCYTDTEVRDENVDLLLLGLRDFARNEDFIALICIVLCLDEVSL